MRRALRPALLSLTAAALAVGVVACGDDAQALVWLVRADTLGRGRRDRMLARDAAPVRVRLRVPGVADQ